MTVPTKLAEATQRLRYLMDKKEELEDALKRLNLEAKRLKEHTIPKILEDAELEKATVDDAGTIYVKQELYTTLIGADVENGEVEPPFYDWARRNAPDLIKPYIHPRRLQAYCRDRLEQGLPLPDNMIKATFIPTAQLRRK